ncbi:CLIP domain-containing serine protease B4-like isoform X2 [Wyeomyia smithii]|uniref:CLIP domain-containing serine protease B4-like isoform X2 n=1 Tax=Wyeomyia smithii TaxID=174621 RepID=UPI002468088D|nr:CLIP domain-containing serine protease B4-like isoform X2 [Wyeomyia smithii]
MAARANWLRAHLNQGANETCVTTEGLEGNCIKLNKCNQLLSQSDVVNEILDTSKCGFEADYSTLVCCPKWQNKDRCGLTTNQVDGSVDNVTFPWVVDVIYKLKQRYTAFDCAGSLINSWFVLSAAHCVLKVPSRYKPFKIRINGKPFRHEHIIQKTIVHPNYLTDYLNIHNDIALFKLMQGVQFNEFAQPVCLPSSIDNNSMMLQRESILTIFAVGPISDGTTKRTKRLISMPLKDPSVCNNLYQPLGLQLDDAQLCVGGEPKQDSCRGDSGGPLMMQQQGHWYQIGIISLGPERCGGKIPGIYVNLLKYINWIEETLDDS